MDAPRQPKGGLRGIGIDDPYHLLLCGSEVVGEVILTRFSGHSKYLTLVHGLGKGAMTAAGCVMANKGKQNYADHCPT